MTVLRIIDANANRAREAFRVMEDSARFLLDDRNLCTVLKQLRHDLATVLRRIDGLEAHRDTPTDVGTAITTDTEMRRQGVTDVVAAAGRRLGEALRAIEEYGKLLPGGSGIASQIEQIRYRAYETEKQLTQQMGSGRAPTWRLCVLLSKALCPSGRWREVARAAVAAGCDCIQLREKSLDDHQLLDRAKYLTALCHDHGASLIVNDRPDIALLAAADGVHLGQDDLACTDARKLAGTRLLVGVSTSRVSQVETAVRQGADYCGIGPMFHTTTKKKDVIVGLDYAARFLAAFPTMPHLAVGGINSTNLACLTTVGVRGVAVSRAVCGAEDPGAVVRQLLALMVVPGGKAKTSSDSEDA